MVWAGGLVLVGGLVVTVGTFLPWFDVTSQGVEESITGASLGLGIFTFVLALVLVLAAGALLYYTGWHGLAWSVVAIAAGTLAMFVGLRIIAETDTMLVDRAVEDVAGFYDVADPSAAKADVQAALGDGTLVADPGTGAWVVLIGGGVALAGGVAGVGIWGARRR
jgi:hypothetical protein